MKKTATFFFVSLVVLIIAGFALFFTADHLMKCGVEKYAPGILGVDVKVKKVSLSILATEARIQGLMIYNPPGYRTGYAVKANHIVIKLDLTSLLSNTIIIKKLDIDKPHVVYEVSAKGSNINAIANDINSQAIVSRQKLTTRPSKKIVINELTIRKGRITGELGTAGATLSLPTITLKDVGKKESGISPTQVTQAIFETVINSLQQIDVNALIKPLNLKKIGDTASATATKVKKTTGSIGKSVSSAASKANQTASKASDGIARDVDNTLKNIFGSSETNGNK